MGLVRRRRGCVRNNGRGLGGGTRRTRKPRSLPESESSCETNGSFLARASRNAATFQPAGETAPIPAINTPALTRIGGIKERRSRHQNRTNSKARNQRGDSVLLLSSAFERGGNGRLDPVR